MKQQGFIAISMVLLLVVVVMAVATTVAFLSIGEGQSGLAIEEGEGVHNLIEECAEDVLIRSRNDAFFTGGTLTEPEGTCYALKSGNVWTIYNTSPSNFVRTIQVTFTRNAYGITFTPGTTQATLPWVEQ